MGRKADLAFLTTMLIIFRKSPENEVSTKEVVACIAADIMLGKLPEMRDMTPKLFKDFSIGYRNAIKKYGETEANERMKEYLIKVICNNTDYTRESLSKYLDKVWNSTELFTDGIHLTKDEFGEYHNNDER